MKKSDFKVLLESEISDFVAALGSPGYCETPEDIQAELLKRFMPFVTAVTPSEHWTALVTKPFPATPAARGRIGGNSWLDWNQLSALGLLVRINQEILHPVGLSAFRDPITGASAGALIAEDGIWKYAE